MLPRPFKLPLPPLLLLAGALALPAAATAQQSGEAPLPSDPWGFSTEAMRSPQQVLETPHAISVVTADELRARPAASLDEALDLVPGIFAQGGRNLAQDARISVRGHGARAEFGVRGIRILVDGVPTTLPDGQSETDSIDLAFVERIDVVRSPVSALYGGGGGGLVAIETLRPTAEPTIRARSLFGSDHLSRYSLTSTGQRGETGYALGVAYTRQSGYRDHARGRQTTWLAKLERELDSGWQLRASYGGVAAPEGQDPGGLTLGQVAADRTQARPDPFGRDPHEKLQQHKLSIELRRPFDTDRELRAMVYGLRREFSNALPVASPGRVDFDRNVLGGALIYRSRTGPIAWTLGLDADVQLDHRENHENLDGSRGQLLLDQSETVRAIGPWARASLALSPDLELVAGVRYDRVEFVVGDRLVDDGGDRSDRMRFRQLSPHVSVHWGRTRALQLYANLGSAFRVPTTTELAPNDGAGGFRSDLEPESTLGLELGAKGVLPSGLAWDLALFDMRLRHVAVPFEDAMGDFWRDAGRSRRRGAELALSADLGNGLFTRVGYTYADYRYVDFDTGEPGGDFGGKREPNTPMHSGTAELRWEHGSGLFAIASVRHFSDIEVDDANEVEARGATLSDIRVGYDWQAEHWRLRPFAGIRNWSRARYDQTLRPNAFGGRHFEPAPLAELYVGMDLLLE